MARICLRVLMLISGLVPAVVSEIAVAQAPGENERVIFVGVVIVAEPPREQENSGSLVTDPKAYEEIPGLHVVSAQIPASNSTSDTPAGTASLQGLIVDTGDGRKQPADSPLTWTP